MPEENDGAPTIKPGQAPANQSNLKEGQEQQEKAWEPSNHERLGFHGFKDGP